MTLENMLPIFISLVALIISVISALYTRRKHLAETVPDVSFAWGLEKYFGYSQDSYSKPYKGLELNPYIKNNSSSIPLANVNASVFVAVARGRLKRKLHCEYRHNATTTIEPTHSWQFAKPQMHTHRSGMSESAYFEEFIAREIGTIEQIKDEKGMVVRCIVNKNKPIYVNMNVKYRPGIYGAKQRRYQACLKFTPISELNREIGELILKDWRIEPVKGEAWIG